MMSRAPVSDPGPDRPWLAAGRVALAVSFVWTHALWLPVHLASDGHGRVADFAPHSHHATVAPHSHHGAERHVHHHGDHHRHLDDSHHDGHHEDHHGADRSGPVLEGLDEYHSGTHRHCRLEQLVSRQLSGVSGTISAGVRAVSRSPLLESPGAGRVRGPLQAHDPPRPSSRSPLPARGPPAPLA